MRPDDVTVTEEQLKQAIKKLKDHPASKTQRNHLRRKLEKRLEELRRPKLKLRDLSEIQGLAEVERRILRAYKTLRVLPDKEIGWLRVKSGWPEVMREWSDLVGANPIPYVETFQPTETDIDDMSVAIGWLIKIKKGPELRKKYQRLFMVRSMGFSWFSVAHRMGVQEWRVGEWRKDALFLAWRIAISD